LERRGAGWLVEALGVSVSVAEEHEMCRILGRHRLTSATAQG